MQFKNRTGKNQGLVFFGHFIKIKKKESKKKYLHRLAIRSRNDFDHFSTSSRDGLTVDACNDESVWRRLKNRNRCFISSRPDDPLPDLLQKKKNINIKIQNYKNEENEKFILNLIVCLLNFFSLLLQTNTTNTHWFVFGVCTKKKIFPTDIYLFFRIDIDCQNFWHGKLFKIHIGKKIHANNHHQ